jgi:hypothetical protein
MPMYWDQAHAVTHVCALQLQFALFHLGCAPVASDSSSIGCNGVN